MPETSGQDEARRALSDDARQVAAAWFGAMLPGSTSQLRFAMVESKPSERSQAGLDELVSAGIISREDEPTGAVIYRPLVSCREYFAWMAKRMFADEPIDSFRLVDRIAPGKKPLKRAGTMSIRALPVPADLNEGGGNA